MTEGMINLLKPAGMTSHDAVAKVRRLTGVKRVGHTGTLDPMAAGVLPIGIGSAARIAEYLDLDEKIYRCELLLGVETDTQDIWGTVTADRRHQAGELTEQAVIEAFSHLSGNRMQLPPKYSALKVNGKRLYQYAREGVEVEIKPRPVSISNVGLVDMDMEHGRVMFDVTCSKGTYIRSICSEVGEALGCGACMSFLLRMQSGFARLSEAVTLEELQEPGALSGSAPAIVPVEQCLPDLGRFDLRSGRGKWFSNGGWLTDKDGRISREPFQAARTQTGAWQMLKEKIRHLQTGEELLRTYLVFEDGVFLGTAVFDEQEQRYCCGKVFRR